MISNAAQQRLARFEKQTEEFRQLLRIPGMSAVILKDQQVLWAEGFGFADLQSQIPAAPDTLFHIASLTKTFSATLVMQLVEQGKLDLDEPVSHYSSDFEDDAVKVKHLLSHTSEGTPGEAYRYSGNRYDYLTPVLEKKTGKPFRQLLVETFLDPLAMASSVPSHDVLDEADQWGALLGEENLKRYKMNLLRLSQPYTLYGDSEIVQVPHPPKDVNAAAGLLSTVLDMAKYDAAIDRHLFLKKETQAQAWTAFVSNAGKPLLHGLGWFVDDYQGHKLIWHFGHWGTGFSAIYLKVPEKNLSLVMLANSEALSDHQFQVGESILSNAFACAFLRLFVSPSKGDGCTQDSHTAAAKWLEQRRASARSSIRVSPEILEPYVGRYQAEWAPDRILKVSRAGERLFINLPENTLSELFAEAEATFFMKIRPYQIIFRSDESRVTQLEIVFGAETYRANRIP